MSFFEELKRRNVFRAGIAYLAVAWLGLQIADLILPNVGAPSWIITALIVSCAAGFPVVLLLAWYYEWTAAGLKAESALETSAAANLRGRRLDFVVIGVLLLAVGFLAVDNYLSDPTAAAIGYGEARPSIAVLPFRNDSAAEEDAEFFANGMHEELLTRLFKFGALTVISRTSVMAYRDSPTSISQIGDELGVSTILQGYVQRAGDMLRINVQLIDAATNEHLWADTYDREFNAENVFAIQAEMATAIANALHVELLPEQIADLETTPTLVTSALNSYLRGLNYMSSVTLSNDEATPLAVDAFRDAVNADEDFAEAWAALSDAHMVMYASERRDRSPERLTEAQEALARAERLEPYLPQVHLAWGRYYYGVEEYERALASYVTAEQGMPGSADVFRRQAAALEALGQIDEAIAARAHLIELDPLDVSALSRQGSAYFMRRQYSKAEELLGRAQQLTPRRGLTYALSRIPLTRDGNAEAARAVIASSGHREPEWGVGLRWVSWTAAIFAEEYDLARKIADDFEDVIDVENYVYAPKILFVAMTDQLANRADTARNGFLAAREHIEPLLAENDMDYRLYVALGGVLAGLSRRDEALSIADRAIARFPERSTIKSWVRYQLITQVLAPLGPSDLLFEQLDAYLQEPGEWSIEGLSRDPRFASVRDDAAFVALLDKYARN